MSSVESINFVAKMSRASLSISPGHKQWADRAKSEPSLPTAKRKRKDSMDYDLKTVTISTVKRKQAKRSKLHSPNGENDLDLVQGLNLTIATLNSQLLADYVAKRTKRFSPNLSLVELDAMYISETAFCDTTSWEKERTLQDMPSFLEHYTPKAVRNVGLSSASQLAGSPHTLIITSAGLRAANISRALRIFQTEDAVVAKLFAKHIKLREAMEFVKKSRIGFGIGTPTRIMDLLDSGALSSSNLEQVIVDCSHIDEKRRGILDMRETQQPLMALLNRAELKSRYGCGTSKVRLLFY